MTCSLGYPALIRRCPAFFLLLLMISTPPSPALGQGGGLQDHFLRLFTFGTGCGEEVLFCLQSGSGTPDFAQEAFSTNANATAQELTLFLQSAIALGIATVPAPSAGSGESFRLSALGVPVRAEEKSLGPVLAERTLTLGRGSLLIGANVTDLRFERLRGVSLEDLQFNVVQRDLPPTGPPLGDPAIERTYLSVTTRMALDARVANFFVSYGLTDRLDISALVPLVQASLSGFSEAEIVIGQGEDPAAGFSFGGPTEDPKLLERSIVDPVRATGLGDISIRGKYRFSDSERRIRLAALADIRIPTGREDDFLGSQGTWVQGMGIVAMDAGGGFTPHLNAGAVLRGGEGQRDAMTLALGVDHRTSNRLTLAAELLGQLPLGENPLVRQEIVIRDTQGNDNTVITSNLPTLRDDLFDAALGFKIRLGKLAVIGNALIPLNDGGLRSDVLWTIGLQGGF
jgi:hypothetical protein